MLVVDEMDGHIKNTKYVQKLGDNFLDEFQKTTESYCNAYVIAIGRLTKLEELIEEKEKNPEEINELTEKLVFADINLKSEEQKRDLKRRLYIDVLNRYEIEEDEYFEETSKDYNVLKEKYQKTVGEVLQKHNELCEKDKRLKTFAMIFQDIDYGLYEEGRAKFMSMHAEHSKKETTQYFKKVNGELKEDIDKAYQ